MAMQGIQSPGAAAELTRLVAGDQKTGQLDELKRLEAEGKDAQAARKFEALFASMLISEMRKSMPEGFFGDASGSDVYGQWFDRHMGEAIADDGGLGLAGMLKAQLGLSRVDGYVAADEPVRRDAR